MASKVKLAAADVKVDVVYAGTDSRRDKKVIEVLVRGGKPVYDEVRYVNRGRDGRFAGSVHLVLMKSFLASAGQPVPE